VCKNIFFFFEIGFVISAKCSSTSLFSLSISYYLQRYGSNKNVVRFWLRHRLLEDACRFVFAKKLSPSFFVEEILQYCLSNGIVADLQTALKRIGMTKRERFSWCEFTV
jgi:hypothetical protein